MITISFYSYKGGVGRSLALTNLGVYLAQFGASVVMVDLDLEAPGLQYKLLPGKPPLDVSEKSLAQLLAQASRGAPPDALDYDIAVDVTACIEPDLSPEPAIAQESGRLLLIPAGDPTSSSYWTCLSGIDWMQLFGGSRRPGVVVMDRLRRHLVDSYNPDVLLVDSRTGMTPSGGVATTLLPDVVVMLLLNTPEHLDGSRVVVSAIAEASAYLEQRPRVVPVLSRFTGAATVEPVARASRASPQALRARLEREIAEEEDRAVGEVHAALTDDLNPLVSSIVEQPFVLHTDLALQRSERLSFGPNSGTVRASEPGGGLLDDYLRLFSSLVPKEVVKRHLGGVRNRVRAIILDRPDDAVRTLENLAALVGDEDIFRDLIKVHVLRRDVQGALAAAERLFAVHGAIVVEPWITRSLTANLGSPGRGLTHTVQVDPEFAHAYWQVAAPDNFEFGIGVVLRFARHGSPTRAEEIGVQMVETSRSVAILAQLVERLAAGDDTCERLAVRVATRYFDLGNEYEEFVDAAAIAVRYQGDESLADLVVKSPAFMSVDPVIAVYVLLHARRLDESASQLREMLLGEADEDVRESLSDAWMELGRRIPGFRTEMTSTNPQIVQAMDSFTRNKNQSHPLPQGSYI